MKKRVIISVTGCLMTVLIMAITSIAQDKQPGISSSLKEMSVVYEDQFDTHTNHWPEYENNRAAALIEDGEYHIQHNEKKGYHVVVHPYGVSMEMDSMIQISISDVRGSGKYAYGFVFGAKDTTNNYSFQIRSGNVYVIEKMLDGKRIEVARGPIDNTFSSNSFGTTLKLVKQRNKIRFYVDDYYVGELPLASAALPGDLVGFFVEGRVKISVDWTRTQMKYKG